MSYFKTKYGVSYFNENENNNNTGAGSSMTQIPTSNVDTQPKRKLS